jgi:RNA polymerase sigma-70 factor (ECF subfamily)
VLSITRRTCADVIRRLQRQRRLLRRLAEQPDADTTVDGSAVELNELVARLDIDRRTAFVLTQELGLSYDDAAEVCDCPIGTIRSRVARARFDLVQQLHHGTRDFGT